MYVDSSSITVNHKTYTRHLLRTSFRKDAFRTSKNGCVLLVGEKGVSFQGVQ